MSPFLVNVISVCVIVKNIEFVMRSVVMIPPLALEPLGTIMPVVHWCSEKKVGGFFGHTIVVV